MGLRISNKATAKQKALLKKLEYIGTGKYRPDNLSVQEAAELIDELLEEERLARRITEEDKETEAWD